MTYFDIDYYDVLPSTNAFLKELAEKGEKEGKVVVANEQTAGKGRFDRRFFSPQNSGIYMSVLLRPKIPAQNALLITTAAAVAVCKAIEKFSDCKAEIKWVNDVYIENKKVCGILTEAKITKDGFLEYAVLGIGVNIFLPQEGFPAEITDKAKSVFKSEDSGNLKEKLTEEILSEFFVYYENLEEKSFFNEYKNRCFILGKEIEVNNFREVKKATAINLDEDFRLLVSFPDNSTEFLSSGEVSIRTQL